MSRARAPDPGVPSLSRLIGRNSAYIQQFIGRGVPKRLSEGDRHNLARYFGIAEVELGRPGHDRNDRSRTSSSLIPVPRLNVDASAGPGAFNDSESENAHIGFEEKWLRRVSRSKSSDLSVIKVIMYVADPVHSEAVSALAAMIRQVYASKAIRSVA